MSANFEKWSVQPDGKGAFNACFESEHPITGEKRWSAAKSGITFDEAKAHVEMAERHNREKAEKMALCEGLFDKRHWKYPTKRLETDDEELANRTADALTYFCGGSEISAGKRKRFSVGSLGYFHYVGA
jgi:hypothetical protein